MTNRRRKRLKNSKIPVIKKDLEDGVVAEANNDGTIYVDKDVKSGSPLEKEAIAHEMVHMDQMKRGDLDYDDNNVYWKGKKYSRKQMNEGSSNLPWEKEAYDKTDHIDGSNNRAGSTANNNNKEMKKSSPNKIIYSGARQNTSLGSRTMNQRASFMNDQLKIKADKHAIIGEGVGKIQKQLYDGDFKNDKKGHHDFSNPDDNTTNTNTNTDTPNKMKATPITMRASRSAMKFAPLVAMAGKALVGAAAKKAVDSAVKMKSSPLHVETTSTREFQGNLGEQSGTFTETKRTKKGDKKKMPDNLPTYKQTWDANNKNVQSKYDTFEEYEKAAKEYNKMKYGTGEDEVKYETTFKGDTKEETTQEPGTPGTPDKYNMGYYESMDAKYGAGVRNRDRKKLGRILDREGRRYDRGKGSINPETGKKFETKEDYLSYVAKSRGSEFNIPVGKTRTGTPGKEAGEKVTTTSNVEANPDQDTYIINDDGTTSKVDKKSSAAGMNKYNKNKSAFKMKGFSGFNKQ